MDTKMQSIIQRIKNLQALAHNNENTNELLAATSAANKLMAEHRIDQAMLEAAGSIKAEPFVHIVVGTGGRRRAWCEVILSAICNSYSSVFYLSSRRSGGWAGQGRPDSKGSTVYTVCGRQSDADMITYLFNYLIVEVDKLGKIAAKGRGLSFASAWRLGCSEGIRIQFANEREMQKQAAQTNVSAAIVLLDNRMNEAKQEMRRHLGSSARSAASIYGARSNSGRLEGRVAGQSISIRKGLNQ